MGSSKKIKAGDLVQIHYGTFDLSGIVVDILTNPELPTDWPRIVVLWSAGKLEQMHEEDLAVISEAG